MKIESIKDLQKLISLCRKTGVESIRVDGIEIHLGHLPMQYSKPYKQASMPNTPVFTPGGITEETTIPNELTDEQRMFWSSQGHADEQETVF